MPVPTAVNSSSFHLLVPSDHEITLTRLFDAPRAVVFDAMTKPEHVARWWGRLGDGYSVPVCEIDFRPGGAWRFTNQTPRGERVTFYGVYREITPPHRFVYTESFEANPDVESVVTTVLEEEGGKTRLIVTATYPSIEVRDMVRKSGMERGAALSYDRLEEVARELSGD